MHDSVERADNVLLNHRSKEESSLKSAGSSALENRTSAGISKVQTLSQVLQRLRSKMYAREMREKMKIDPRDHVMDLTKAQISIS